MPGIEALNGRFVLDPSESRVSFVARHAMVTKVRGTFTAFSGAASTGPHLAGATVAVDLDVASVRTGNGDRDDYVRGGDFFDVATYPRMTFVSTSVTAARADVVRITGDLTVRDVTRPVSIDVRYREQTGPGGSPGHRFVGSTVVSRKDFGLTWNAALEAGGLLVADRVTLEVDVLAVPVDG